MMQCGKLYYKIRFITSMLITISWLLNIPAAYTIKDLVDNVVAYIEKGSFLLNFLN